MLASYKIMLIFAADFQYTSNKGYPDWRQFEDGDVRILASPVLFYIRAHTIIYELEDYRRLCGS